MYSPDDGSARKARKYAGFDGVVCSVCAASCTRICSGGVCKKLGRQSNGPTESGKVQPPPFALTAATLRQSHPAAPALDVLDLAMQGHLGVCVDLSAAWLAPGSPFGQVLAAALDRTMSPEEWAASTRPPADPALQAAMLTIWRDDVLPPFVGRYRLTP